MKGKVSLNLNQTRLLWGQTTEGTTSITNEGETSLEYSNYDNDRVAPTFVLTDLQTGTTIEHARKNLPGSTPYEITIKPGETWESEFNLCYKFQFPTAGSFEIKTRFDWYDGSAESEPIRVEVLPTTPLARQLETTGGGPVGDLFCAWVNEEENGAGLWLSSIGALSEARFQEAQRLCDIPVDAQPVLSVPPNTSPTGQYVAWIDGQTLKYVVHTHGQLKTDEIALDTNGYKIIPPLLEDLYIQPDVKQNAEALLMREMENGWEMRVITLGDKDAPRKPLQVSGAMPNQCYTAYRSDVERRTIFWQQSVFSAGEPTVILSVSKWMKGETPQPPELKTNWVGAFVAADQSLTGDDAVIGAVLLYVGTATHAYELRTWRLDSNDDFTESPAVPLLWNSDAAIEEAVIRIRPDEAVFALLRSIKDNLWRLRNNDNELKLLPDALQNSNGTINIFFVNQSVPAFLYTDPKCGLRIAFDGPAPKRFSPAGY